VVHRAHACHRQCSSRSVEAVLLGQHQVPQSPVVVVDEALSVIGL
jgi:hypothetical protein